jgi:hypothetical protein
MRERVTRREVCRNSRGKDDRDGRSKKRGEKSHRGATVIKMAMKAGKHGSLSLPLSLSSSESQPISTLFRLCHLARLSIHCDPHEVQSQTIGVRVPT